VKQFIIYDEQGFILRCGNCADSDIDLQARDSESVIEGIADDSTQMIINGVVCDKPEPEGLTDEELIAIAHPEIRARRNERLIKSDWTQFQDSPLSDTKKLEWADYRQVLRDIPDTYSGATSIDDIIWPTKPQ
jgi:hypothetical protein